MRRRPIIGIPTQTLHSIDGIPEGLPESWVMNQRYSRAVAAAGGLPVMIPLLDDEDTLRALYDRMDGLLLPGGVDLDPATYGESPLPTLRPPRPRARPGGAQVRPLGDRGREAAPRPLPRSPGHQRGARRHALPGHRGAAHRRDQARLLPDRRLRPRPPGPRVTVASGSRLDALVGAAPLEVNSMHHQGVKDLAPGLVPTAVAPDGLIEALESPASRFLLGVQWHPESLTDRDPRMHRLLAGFVEAASR